MRSILNRLEDFWVYTCIEQNYPVFGHTADLFQLLLYKLAYSHIAGGIPEVPPCYPEEAVHALVHHIFLRAYRHMECADKRHIKFPAELLYREIQPA